MSERSPATRLLSTNGVPSAHEQTIIQGLVMQKQQHLSALEDRVHVLALEIARVRSDLREHRALLSGARKLPMEILSEVFLHCLPNVDISPLAWRPEPHCCDAPLLLTQVCRTWRSVAIATPRLWSTLIIDASNGSQSHTEISKLWLCRSRNAPLTLSLSISLDRFQREGYSFPCEKFVPAAATGVMNLFIPHFHRVRELALLFALPVIRALPDLPMVSDNSCPMLETLHLTTCFENSAQEIAWTRSLVHSAPTLRNLYFDSSMVPLPILRGQEWCLRLRTINLDAAYGIEPEDFLLLLLSSPELTQCIIVLNLDESDDNPTRWDRMLKVSHSALLNLSISGEDGLLGNILARLTLPALLSLKTSTVGDDIWPHTQLMDFFSRSLCVITELKLDSEMMSDDELLVCLRVMNSTLRSLHLPTWKSVSDRILRFITPPKTLNNFHPQSPEPSPAPLALLLPKLEQLTLAITVAPHRHTAVFREFVEARCLTAVGEVTKLRVLDIHLLPPLIPNLRTDVDSESKTLLERLSDDPDISVKVSSYRLKGLDTVRVR